MRRLCGGEKVASPGWGVDGADESGVGERIIKLTSSASDTRVWVCVRVMVMGVIGGMRRSIGERVTWWSSGGGMKAGLYSDAGEEALKSAGKLEVLVLTDSAVCGDHSGSVGLTASALPLLQRAEWFV